MATERADKDKECSERLYNSIYSLPPAYGSGSNSLMMISPGWIGSVTPGMSGSSGLSGTSGRSGSTGGSSSLSGEELTAPGVPPRGSVERCQPEVPRSHDTPEVAASYATSSILPPAASHNCNTAPLSFKAGNFSIGISNVWTGKDNASSWSSKTAYPPAGKSISGRAFVFFPVTFLYTHPSNETVAAVVLCNSIYSTILPSPGFAMTSLITTEPAG